jgi:hypothetical protein
MSAAAARRKKQLAAREQEGDNVAAKLKKLLAEADDEPTAYEALQLAQSQTRKAVNAGKFDEATELAYNTALELLQKKKTSVASQLLQLLVEVLRETHTDSSAAWIDKIAALHAAHQTGLKDYPEGPEKNRLQRLQREWLRRILSWSSDVGTINYGHPRLHELLADQCWSLPEGDEDEDRHAIMCDAAQHMVLAEQPLKILEWLKTLPPPTDDQTAMGHICPAADRDALLTRSLLTFCAVENLRDAHVLLQKFVDEVETRNMDDLTKSYMSKDDGKSQAHVVFCSMLLRICEKDQKTGPLWTWLLRSFKKELDLLAKPQVVQSYTTKIGKVYFNIQPPPSMMSMMENMMGMMGGGGGMNPAMMAQAMQSMQGM